MSVKNNYKNFVSSARPASWLGFSGGSTTRERAAGLGWREAGKGREALRSPGPLGSFWIFPSDLSSLSLGLGIQVDRDPKRETLSGKDQSGNRLGG